MVPAPMTATVSPSFNAARVKSDRGRFGHSAFLVADAIGKLCQIGGLRNDELGHATVGARPVVTVILATLVQLATTAWTLSTPQKRIPRDPRAGQIVAAVTRLDDYPGELVSRHDREIRDVRCSNTVHVVAAQSGRGYTNQCLARTGPGARSIF